MTPLRISLACWWFLFVWSLRWNSTKAFLHLTFRDPVPNPSRNALSKYAMTSEGGSPAVTKEAIGLIGGFDGDEEVWREVLWLQNNVATLATSPDDKDWNRFLSLCDALPSLEKMTVVILGQADASVLGPLMDRLLDECLITTSSDDGTTDDFVLLDSRSTQTLNGDRYHIMSQVLLPLLGVTPPAVAIRVARTYLESASTRFRSQMLRTLVACSEVSDDEIFKYYQTAPEGLRKALLQNCADMNRLGVLELLDDPNWVFFCTTDYVASKLKDVWDRPSVYGSQLLRWGVHGTIYLEFLRQKLGTCGDNVLEQGRVWRHWISLFPTKETIADDLVHEMWKIMLEDFMPCRLDSSLPAHIQAHLERLAANKSSAVMLSYKGVQRLQRSWTEIWLLSRKERRRMLIQAFQEDDWDFFSAYPEEAYHSLLLGDQNRSNTFVPADFVLTEKVTTDDLWKWIRTGQCNNPFVQQCLSRDLDFLARQSLLRLSVDAFYEKKELYLRSLPKDAKDWPLWFKSFHDESFLRMLKRVKSKVHRTNTRVRPIPRSRVTLYARALHVLFKASCELIATAESHVDLDNMESSKAQLSVLEFYYDAFYHAFHCGISSHPPVVASLLRDMDRVLLEVVLPRLQDLLVFDPRDEKNYLQSSNRGNLLIVKAWIERIQGLEVSIEDSRYNDESFKGLPLPVARGILKMLQTVVARAQTEHGHEILPNGSARFCEWPSDNGKTNFLLFDTNFHKAAIAECLNKVESMIMVTNDEDLQGEIIRYLESHGYFHRRNPRYLQFCGHLVPARFEKERKKILERSMQYYVNHKNANDVCVTRLLDDFGLLEAVLNGCSFLEQSQKNSIRLMAGCENEFKRESLKSKTQGKDSELRLKGHAQFLAEMTSTGNSARVAQALQFSTPRIKNEGGNVRPIYYNRLQQRILNIVTICLAEGESSNNASVSITSNILALCQNDLDRRDSCGKQVFARIARSVLTQALSHDNSKKLVEARQIWVSFAVKLDWIVKQVQQGEKGMPQYTLPLSYDSIPSTQWISAKSFDSVFPLPEKAQQVGNLDAKVNLLDVVKNGDFGNFFLPQECVEMVVKSVREVWNDEYPCADFGLTKGALLWSTVARLVQLFSLVGRCWQEVPLLASTFDELFFHSLEGASFETMETASYLLEHLVKFYKPNSFFHVPRLANACEKFFTYLVLGEWGTDNESRGYQSELARKWVDNFVLVNDFRGAQNDSFGTCDDPGLLSFLLFYNRARSPKVSSKKHVESLSCLLRLTKSAFYLTAVRKSLAKDRSDVVAGYVMASNELGGLFAVRGSRLSLLSPSDLERLPAKLSRAFADYYRARILDRNFSVSERVAAMETFIVAPSTGHGDVLALLDEELNDTLLEALMIKIFSVDSPWHVLGKMFSPDSIEKRPQRMTASLLGHVTKHIHVDIVVKALELFLREPRRQAVRLQLHKAVVRLLASFRTEKAEQLLRREWARTDLPADVRFSIVELCIDAVTGTTSKETDWDWDVLGDVAKDPAITTEMAVLLFAPYCARARNLPATIRKHLLNSPNEKARLFLNQFPSSQRPVTGTTAILFRELYSRMENFATDDYVRKVAKCQRLAFSRIFDDVLEDDQCVLTELGNILETPPASWNELDSLFVEFCSVLFLDGSFTSIYGSVLSKQDDTSGKVSDEVWKDVWANDGNAHDLKQLVERLFESLFNLPMNATAERRKVQTILGVTRTYCSSRNMRRVSQTAFLKATLPYNQRYFMDSVCARFATSLLQDVWQKYTDQLGTERAYMKALHE